MRNMDLLGIVLFAMLFIADAKRQNPFENTELERRRKDPNIKTIFDEYLVFFDEDCLAEKEYSQHDAIQEFLDEYECFKKNRHFKDEFEGIGDRFIVVNRKKNCRDNDEKEIDLDDFCITEIDEDEEIDAFGTNVCSSRTVSSSLWNLDSASLYKSSGLEYITFDSAYDPKVDIIIMDTGVDSTHSEFSDITYELLYDAHDTNTNYHDHGTHCAGTVLGKTYGVFKAASSNVKLLDVRVLDDGGDGSGADVINGYNAIINYLETTKRKAIINMSFGGGNWGAYNVALESIRDNGGISIAAAGNDNSDASTKSPASSSDTITVGAHDSSNNKASFSNYGDLVDIWAPGVSILSAIRGEGTATWQGTSMATPLVVGIAANILASNNDLEFDEIKQTLINYAVFDVDDGRGNTNLPRAQISCSEYGTADHDPSYDLDNDTFPSMDCWQNSNYENSWDSALDAYNNDRLYFNGLYSYHDNGKEDRLFKFRYCKPSGATVSTGGSITLPYTNYDEAWYRGCGGNTAITRAVSHHDNGREDRQWQFRCTPLPDSYRVSECEFNGYLNDWDAVLDYNCPNDGVIRTIYSVHDNGKEDRRWRFECCRVAENVYSYESMNTTKDSDYVNGWDGTHDIGTPSSYLCGQESYHDNGKEDRRFKWKRCKPSTGNVWQSTKSLTETDWDSEFSQTCSTFNEGDAAMIKAYSYHDNGKEDRRWTFTCGLLDASYTLANCGWSGYLNNWDGGLNFDCPNDGVIRSIWSKHDNGVEDRLWRFECCQFVCNGTQYGESSNCGGGYANDTWYIHSYLGCYLDSSDRALRYGPYAYGYTSDTCQAACSSYNYFALQNGGWCCCDDDLDHATKYGVSTNCPSDKSGGAYANDLFRNNEISSAKSVLPKLDWMSDSIKSIGLDSVNSGSALDLNDTAFEIGGYVTSVVFVVGILMMINIGCIFMYCYNNKQSKHKYKVVAMQSTDADTDVDNIL